jgi:hypothetical protein
MHEPGLVGRGEPGGSLFVVVNVVNGLTQHSLGGVANAGR